AGRVTTGPGWPPCWAGTRTWAAGLSSVAANAAGDPIAGRASRAPAAARMVMRFMVSAPGGLLFACPQRSRFSGRRVHGTYVVRPAEEGGLRLRLFDGLSFATDTGRSVA